MNLNDKVAYNIKRLRVEKQIKQAYLASTLKISETSLSKMENGKMDFKLKFLEKLASVLNVQVIELFDIK